MASEFSGASVVRPIQKYCGRRDSRTPPQFLREFRISTCGISNNSVLCQLFLSSFDDRAFPYTPAIYLSSSNIEKLYETFLQLTWSEETRRKELNQIKKKKFNPLEESMESFIIEIYLRLYDCQLPEVTFEEEMKRILGLFEVKKVNLSNCFSPSFIQFAKAVCRHFDGISLPEEQVCKQQITAKEVRNRVEKSQGRTVVGHESHFSEAIVNRIIQMYCLNPEVVLIGFSVFGLLLLVLNPGILFVIIAFIFVGLYQKFFCNQCKIGFN